jgi:hypothetical protein
VRELFHLLRRNHRGIKLLDACALDHPELQDAWNRTGRSAYRDLLASILTRRAARGRLNLMADSADVARFVIETVTTWAVHIHFDRFPQPIEEDAAERMVVHFLLAGLVSPSP